MKYLAVLVSLMSALISSCCTPAPASKEACRQKVVVLGDEGIECDIRLMEREKSTDTTWQCVYETRGILGRNGIVAGEEKREGDGCTPDGTYALKRGFWSRPDLETRFPMEVFDQGYVWIDDPQNPDYNTLVRDDEGALDGHGERLSKIGPIYDYIVAVEYNTDPVVAGRGSAIFIHISKEGEDRASSGCITMSREDMRRLIAWLEPEKHPSIVISHKGE